MTIARNKLVNVNEVGYYHCMSRCVRRAFLCGVDEYLKKSFEHRREWIRNRLLFLIETFAIEVVAYAIMSNHLHTLIRVRPDLVEQWSAEEVAIRWRRLFPLRREAGRPAEPSLAEIEAITSQPQLVIEYRNRLSSISWFNRCLNERIAKMANLEDQCTGRFWEGRFKCQKVVDLSSILACAAYIDLNPIRAKIAQTPEGSDYTSIQDRLRLMVRGTGDLLAEKLLSFEVVSGGTFTTAEYINLIDKTGRSVASGKGSIPNDLAPILQRMNLNPDYWLKTATNYRKIFPRMAAPTRLMRTTADEIGQFWLKGVRLSRAVFTV